MITAIKKFLALVLSLLKSKKLKPKYPDLTKNLKLTRPNQVWLIGTTYQRAGDKYLYIHYIIDAYSHMLTGFQITEALNGEITALQGAISNFKPQTLSNLILHDESGTYYLNSKYIELLQSNNIKLSMKENSNN